MSWRLKWALEQPKYRAQHRQVLRRPWKFWAALLLKIAPGIWPWSIRLDLRGGGSFAVREFMTLYIYKEIFVDRCYDPGLALDLGPAPVVVDIGANTGLFLVRTKQLHPKASAVGFEPMAANFSCLKETLSSSVMTDVEVRMQGVGGTARRERLFIHPTNVGGHSIDQRQSGVGAKFVEIELVGVNDVLDGLPRGRCDLMKVDCEGAEYEILKSLTPAAASRIGNIVFEPTAGLYDVDQLLAHLRGLGYVVSVERDVVVATQTRAGGAADLRERWSVAHRESVHAQA